MSRGAGWVERAILDALARNAVLDTFQVTAAVFDCRPRYYRTVTVSDAQLTSVRRALRNLETQGKVFGERRLFGRRRRLWSQPGEPGATSSDAADQPNFDAEKPVKVQPNFDTEKLVKVLGMLGSEHPGEVTAAGLQAHKLVTAAGLGWSDLIKGAKARR